MQKYSIGNALGLIQATLDVPNKLYGNLVDVLE
jgi:hypothetical protein